MWRSTPSAPFVRTYSSVLTTFPIFYAILYEKPLYNNRDVATVWGWGGVCYWIPVIIQWLLLDPSTQVTDIEHVPGPNHRRRRIRAAPPNHRRTHHISNRPYRASSALRATTKTRLEFKINKLKKLKCDLIYRPSCSTLVTSTQVP